MTPKSHISIAAFVSEGEQAAMTLAAAQIAQALSKAAEVSWTCDCAFHADLEKIPPVDEGSIIVTSLLPQLTHLEEPWPEVEQRLRKTYALLGARGVPIFISTILRFVAGDEKTELAEALKIRIRRLNLLATEISREAGAFVIDLDRILADVGARRLQTDYQLMGQATANLAAHFIALTLISNALDAIAPFELQDAAREILASVPPAIAEISSAKPETTLRKDLMVMGQGRRKQFVTPVLFTVEDNYIGWLTRQVLQGRIAPREALGRLILAVRKRGLRESAVLLAAGLSKQLSRKK